MPDELEAISTAAGVSSKKPAESKKYVPLSERGAKPGTVGGKILEDVTKANVTGVPASKTHERHTEGSYLHIKDTFLHGGGMQMRTGTGGGGGRAAVSDPPAVPLTLNTHGAFIKNQAALRALEDARDCERFAEMKTALESAASAAVSGRRASDLDS